MTQPMLPIGAVLGEREPCAHRGAVLSRCVGNNGIGLWCDHCRSWATMAQYGKHWLPKDHEALQGLDLRSLPETGVGIYRRCEGPCRQLSLCEENHMAPKAFFGEEADQWPTVWLCDSCHDRWHAKLTPGLCTTHDPERHARQLINYLGLDRAAELTRELTHLGRARRAGAA